MNDIIIIALLAIIAAETTWLLLSSNKKPGGGQLKLAGIKQKKVIIDTCALIDGRVVELAKGGFLPSELVIPQFIIDELQQLADGRDPHKRERARFGLDVVKQLQALDDISVVIDAQTKPAGQEVDQALIDLAARYSCQLYTTDFNLAEVATIHGVHVLNINQLVLSLRPIVLPGETAEVKIIEKGTGRDQGVGYLSDGTMVVVDGAGRRVGETLNVSFSRTIQTSAGKMLFAEVPRAPKTPKASKSPAAATPTDKPKPAPKTDPEYETSLKHIIEPKRRRSRRS